MIIGTEISNCHGNLIATFKRLLRYVRMLSRIPKLALMAILVLPATAQAQEVRPTTPSTEEDKRPVANTLNKAGDIATQPVRDVGAKKREIPPVLERAAQDPYATTGARTCSQISASMAELGEVLGPDYVPGHGTKENRAGKLAEAGGKTVVNALIPFRGLVREVSGAAPAERRYNAALDAGLVRRGFLRGLAVARGCKLTTARPIKG
ncbi:MULTISPECIES: hypothetical protein [Sphingomonadales]|jgi:hypothetical protein|uniref:Uncharacterized protein n=4 Tax=Sphingomonadaceae TaxID=41297 RepID=A0A7W6LSZ0_9SPHN|nr:hypothetical protein [Sphingobium scionense]SMP81326.1 hypothetical protein SAMN06296065_11714 [Novosphingobium panipatense]